MHKRRVAVWESIVCPKAHDSHNACTKGGVATTNIVYENITWRCMHNRGVGYVEMEQVYS